MKPKKGNKRLTLDIDESLHKKLRLLSAETGESIRAIVERAVSEKLSKPD